MNLSDLHINDSNYSSISDSWRWFNRKSSTSSLTDVSCYKCSYQRKYQIVRHATCFWESSPLHLKFSNTYWTSINMTNYVYPDLLLMILTRNFMPKRRIIQTSGKCIWWSTPNFVRIRCCDQSYWQKVNEINLKRLFISIWIEFQSSGMMMEPLKCKVEQILPISMILIQVL